MNHRVVLGIVLLLLAAATRGWLLSLRDDPTDPPLPTVRSDYSLNNFDLWVADQQGLPKYRLSAPRLTQRSNDSQVEIDQPVISLFNNQELSWRVNADSAALDVTEDIVELKGQARMVSSEQTITTQDLIINNRQQRAHSKDAARIEQGQDWMTGRGLSVDMAERRISLAADIVAHYEPAPND